MIVTNAKYYKALLVDGTKSTKNTEIQCVIDGVNSVVPISTNNDDYNEIMRQVDAGTLTIADAD